MNVALVADTHIVLPVEGKEDNMENKNVKVQNLLKNYHDQSGYDQSDCVDSTIAAKSEACCALCCHECCSCLRV